MRATCILLGSLALLALGCQRLDEPDDDPTSGGGPVDTGAGPGGDDNPFESDDDDDALDESGGGGGEMACDPTFQTGCNPNERCTVVGTGPIFGCVPDDGSLEPGDPCTVVGGGADGCPAGFACVAGEGGDGTCLQLCLGSADCDQAVCESAAAGSVPFCADDCSPFESLCPAPLACRRNGERFSCQVPSPDDVGGPGAPCGIEEDAGCGSGTVCIPGALVPECTEPNCCAPLCDLEAMDACGAPATCNAVLAAPAPGFEAIGACFVPA